MLGHTDISDNEATDVMLDAASTNAPATQQTRACHSGLKSAKRTTTNEPQLGNCPMRRRIAQFTHNTQRVTNSAAQSQEESEADQDGAIVRLTAV